MSWTVNDKSVVQRDSRIINTKKSEETMVSLVGKKITV